MKIEKLNDNQIKCTLNKSDLAARQIKLSELAYGTEKAKELFSDMMSQAEREVGFVAEDIPIMIEAIPVSSESIILLVTKIEDPEELDTRFSQFSPYPDEEDVDNEEYSDLDRSVLDLFKQLNDSLENSNFIPLSEAINNSSQKTNQQQDSTSETEPIQPIKDYIQIFKFDNIDLICDLGKMVSDTYDGKNTLYKLPEEPYYYLALHSSGMTLEDFNNICNLISEYGTSIRNINSDEGYYNEHGKIICADKALQKLSLV